ncbi:unnamed protein product [Rhodiola kirilowii]
MGMIGKVFVFVLIGFVALIYQATRPPPPKTAGSPGGPLVTSKRVILRDGRHLAYKEYGLSKENAKHKIVFNHPFGSTKNDMFFLSQEFVEELGVYLVSFDRPGYGESDPDPRRTPETLALDIEDLADQLGLGQRFFVVGFSMGGQCVWGCLKYIPHRLAGAALVAPVINYWWPGFPPNMSRKAYDQQPVGDQWALRIAHYTPWLTYWFNTQKWFPSSSVISGNPSLLSPQDIEILKHVTEEKSTQATQQGEHESIHRDMNVGFGKWAFDPMDLEDSFSSSGASVHLWQGDDDKIIPLALQRYIAERLSWIRYHEVPGAGHLLPFGFGMGETILRSLLSLN